MSRHRLPPFETEITALGPKGVGVGVAPDGRPVQVRGAPPGARVLVRPAGRKRGVWKGVRQALVRPGPDHVPAPCPVFGLCGGCTLQELPLAAQQAHKLARAQEEVGPAAWGPLTTDGGAYAYRNKMEFSFGNARYLSAAAHADGAPIEGRWLGLHAPGRFDRVVDVEVCALVGANMNRVLATVRQAALVDGAPPPWDARRHTGLLRHLQLREGAAGAVLVALYTASPRDEAERAFVSDLLDTVAADPDVCGAHWFVNDGVADVATGALTASRGAERLPIVLLGKRFELSVAAFFQTNTDAAALLYGRIGEALGDGHRVLLDLYCGTGSIGICLADHAERVVGVELVPEAIVDAERNAAANGVEARYRVARVEDALDALAGGPGVAAVVDPPRAGLHPKVAQALAAAPLEVLVYVACNPASLGRDRAVLEQGGWRLERCWAVDLFPQTGHLEVVARFVRDPA